MRSESKEISVFVVVGIDNIGLSPPLTPPPPPPPISPFSCLLCLCFCHTKHNGFVWVRVSKDYWNKAAFGVCKSACMLASLSGVCA